jgi:hypothetical protein
MKRRLKTHLIPYALMAVGYDRMCDDERRSRVKDDYNAFLSARAEILAKAARQTCEGRSIDANALICDQDT